MRTVVTILIGVAALAGCNQEPPVEAASQPVVELRHGGGMEPPPHPVIVALHADGAVQTPGGAARRVDPSRVAEFLAWARGGELFTLDQAAFDRRIADAGEQEPTLRGGSGVYTLTVKLGDAPVTLRLNQPRRYAESKVPAARQFHEAVTRIESLAAEAK